MLAGRGDLRRRSGAAGPARVAGPPTGTSWPACQGDAYRQLLEGWTRSGGGTPTGPGAGTGAPAPVVSDQVAPPGGAMGEVPPFGDRLFAAQRLAPRTVGGGRRFRWSGTTTSCTGRPRRCTACWRARASAPAPRSASASRVRRRPSPPCSASGWPAPPTCPSTPISGGQAVGHVPNGPASAVVDRRYTPAFLWRPGPPVLQPTSSSPEVDRRGGGPSARQGPSPELGAYILFTSGSSGRPKAVEVTHRAWPACWTGSARALTPEELAVTTTSISFSFDPFIIEVLGPLMVGGTVRVIPTALALARCRDGATMLVNTPSVLQELLRAGRLPATLRTIIVGGEVLSTSLAADLLTRDLDSRLINSYGPTEAHRPGHRPRRAPSRRRSRAHRPRSSRRPRRPRSTRTCTRWATGRTGRDLHLRAPGGRGIPGGSDATAERFLDHGAGDRVHRVRIYRTGDWAGATGSGLHRVLRPGGPPAEIARIPHRAGRGRG